jgi:hypothetical protein
MRKMQMTVVVVLAKEEQVVQVVLLRGRMQTVVLGRQVPAPQTPVQTKKQEVFRM